MKKLLRTLVVVGAIALISPAFTVAQQENGNGFDENAFQAVVESQGLEAAVASAIAGGADPAAVTSAAVSIAVRSGGDVATTVATVTASAVTAAASQGLDVATVTQSVAQAATQTAVKMLLPVWK